MTTGAICELNYINSRAWSKKIRGFFLHKQESGLQESKEEWEKDGGKPAARKKSTKEIQTNGKFVSRKESRNGKLWKV